MLAVAAGKALKPVLKLTIIAIICMIVLYKYALCTERAIKSENLSPFASNFVKS